MWPIAFIHYNFNEGCAFVETGAWGFILSIEREEDTAGMVGDHCYCPSVSEEKLQEEQFFLHEHF